MILQGGPKQYKFLNFVVSASNNTEKTYQISIDVQFVIWK